MKNEPKKVPYETKQLLLDCANELFSAEGFDQVSIDAICKKAGVTKGAFYHYFSSKYDIPIQQYRHIQSEFFDYCEGLDRADAPKALRMAIMWYADYCTDVRHYIFANYHKVIINSDKNRILRKINIESRCFAEIIAGGIASGSFIEQIDVNFCAELISRYITSLLQDWVIFGAGMDLTRQMAYLCENILSILLKK